MLEGQSSCSRYVDGLSRPCFRARRTVDPSTGAVERVEIQRPLVVERYNKYMGGQV